MHFLNNNNKMLYFKVKKILKTDVQTIYMILEMNFLTLGCVNILLFLVEKLLEVAR